ncbi:PIR Superfamily Protein [Plasmodium ovale wallikeri]|uniref:PIR Superfamily Protein n=1 Tax=Plasmodium ovale wallikeri TaxID=864142 RepID=A0A1A9AS22_PLAOA|nr:PIR Superfamily Protein [Plasmodium ovale wallikeri]
MSGGCMNMCPDYFRCDDTYNPHNLFKALKCKEYQKFYGGMQTPENVCDIITCDPFYVAFTPLGSYFHNKEAKKKRPIFNKVKSNI